MLPRSLHTYRASEHPDTEDVSSDMENEGTTQEAPVFPLAREDYVKVLQAQKGDLKTPGSLTHPLHRALLSAQDSIKKLNCENITLREKISRLIGKELSTSEALEEFQRGLEELRGIHNNVQEENVEVRIKKIEEDFQKDKRALEAQSRQQQEEINILRNKLLVAQKEQSTERLSAVKDHAREVIRVAEENAATKLRESEEKWQRRVSQLEEDLKKQRSFASSLADKLMVDAENHRTTLTMLSKVQSQLCCNKAEHEVNCGTLEESHRKELTTKEESWRQKMRELEDEICQLRIDNTRPQVPAQKIKCKKWWRRHFRIKRPKRYGRGKSGETVRLLAQSNEI